MLTALIMAGGSGERFWPLSTPSKPKQLLKLFSDKTMVREAVERILPIISREKIFIATNIVQAKEIKKELWDIPDENIIIEPEFKDTAAAIGYASLIIEERFKENKEKIAIAVLASDHFIKKNEEFCRVIKMAEKEVKNNSVIVTLGIKPEKPETGYGYIEVKDEGKVILNNTYKVKRFREKPNLQTAKKYMASEKYFWNSGTFIFTTDTIFKNFEVLMEEHFQIFKKLKKEIKKDKIGIELADLSKPYFQNFEKISIDFGIMEYSKNIRVIPVDIGWSDIGSFSAFSEVFTSDDGNNIVRDTKVLLEDSRNNIIIASDINISLLGVNNLIIVKNGENLLIADRERAQDIKKVAIN